MSHLNNSMQKTLSVIMPLYNVEKTIELALNSILMQQLDFEYEIIAVDDCSGDNTLKILQSYQTQYPNIVKIIKHSKNQGNAISFYDGLSAANGKYFCVLDGDDYYSVRNKLQKQISFLEADSDEKYVAVAHKYLRVDGNGGVFDEYSVYSDISELTYVSWMTNSWPYFHTSTYMYRNIFRGCVPESFKDEFLRGDNPRTFMHLLYSKGKIKVLDFVGSVYVYSQKGIWSSTSDSAKKSRSLGMLSYLDRFLSSTIEKNIWANQIAAVRRSEGGQPDVVCTIDEMLQRLYLITCQYFSVHNDFVFKSLYKSEFVDSFCETLGFIASVQNHIIPMKQLPSNENNILITISNLTTTGGGVYYEIKDIIELYKNKSVYLLLTDANCINDVNSNVIEQLQEYGNLKLVFGQIESSGKINKLINEIKKINPCKIYHYVGHTNVYASAVIQSMFGKNICVFSFDHGFSLGLDNSSYDCYIAKRPMNYELLSKKYKKKVIFMPCWNKDKVKGNFYEPFKNHSQLITACAAARFYKLAQGEYNYTDLIVSLLKTTQGKHVHYGPIPDEELKNIHNKMSSLGISNDRFVHIPWADNMVASMYENNVDIFIEPFPVVSYKISLDVLSAGIPIFIHKDYVRMGITDFIYKEGLFWTDKDSFIKKLSNLDEKTLKKHSELSRDYYLKNHSLDVLSEYFTNEKMFKVPEHIDCWDCHLIDISNVSDLWPDLKRPSKFFGKKKQGNGIAKKLRFFKRMKLFVVFFALMLAQIPVIDLCLRKKQRNKLRKIAEDSWR